MSVKILQTCEMCGRVRKVRHELDQETGGWRTLDHGSSVVMLCNVCIRTIVNHAISRAHSRASNINFPPDVKFWDAQKSEQTV